MEFQAASSRDHSASATATGPAPSSSPAPVALPGPRSRRSGATDPRRCEARPALAARAARGRSTHLPTVTHLRPAPLAAAGASRGAPAGPSHPTRPAREAGSKEEN